MKKVITFAPAAIFAVAIVVLNIVLRAFSPLWYAWMLLLWISGFVMSKGKAWGAVSGLIPGAHLIYMSTQYTGQVINIELPLGLIIVIFYLTCGLVIWKRNRQ